MFNGIHFYHETIRRSVSVFGTLFNDISVVRRDAAGAVQNIAKVPLAYGPKQKFLARIDQQSDLNDPKIAIKMPRMSFELTTLQYDPNTKMQKGTKQTIPNPTPTDLYGKIRVLGPVGYRLGIQLNVLAKNQDDALQIIEQILPFFQPDYTVTIKQINDNLRTDMPFVLQGVSIADDYEGDFLTKRTIVYTLDFETRVRFYGEINQESIIRQVTADFSDFNSQQLLARQVSILNPFDADPDEVPAYEVAVNTSIGSVADEIIVSVGDGTQFSISDIVIGTTSASVGQVTAVNTNDLTITYPTGIFEVGETITIQNTVVTDTVIAVTENW